MSVLASIHLKDSKPALQHSVYPKGREGETFATLTLGDGTGSRIEVFTSNPEDLWNLAQEAGAAAGKLARQLRADEAAARAMLDDTNPDADIPVFAPSHDLGGEAG